MLVKHKNFAFFAASAVDELFLQAHHIPRSKSPDTF